jgi:hypothetical protein
MKASSACRLKWTQRLVDAIANLLLSAPGHAERNHTLAIAVAFEI